QKQEKKLEEAMRSYRSVSSERKAIYPFAEKVLNEWVVQLRQDGLVVILSTIKLKMKELLRTRFQQDYSNTLETFEVSNSWYQGFMNRYNLVLRCYTKVGQKLSHELSKQLDQFYKFIKKS
ncbi:280_t:CDS:1, partial [Racocetra persica]